MPRNRAAAIVLHNDHVLVMFRKNTNEYYTFPGGGIELGETNEQAAIRELKEETSIDGLVERQVYELSYDNGDMHFYFLCTYLQGKPELQPDTNEYKDSQLGLNMYVPKWLPLKDLSSITLYPLEVRDRLISDTQLGFSGDILKFNLKAIKA